MVKGLSKIKGIVKAYRKELSLHNIHIIKAILYGSYAKGNPKAYSDIDLVVVSPDFNRIPPLRRQELLAQWSMNIDAPLEIIGYTPQELRKSSHSIFGEIIRRTGKVLYG